MTPQFTPSLVGNWNISRARDNSSAIETTTMAIVEDSSGNLLLDGHSPIPGGADMIFSGTATADLRAWSGLVSVPGYNSTTFMFVAIEDGSSMGGWVLDPVTGQYTAWAGIRV